MTVLVGKDKKESSVKSGFFSILYFRKHSNSYQPVKFLTAIQILCSKSGRISVIRLLH
jgi:hypothetical protein